MRYLLLASSEFNGGVPIKTDDHLVYLAFQEALYQSCVQLTVSAYAWSVALSLAFTRPT
jgi:hypothetical protein